MRTLHRFTFHRSITVVFITCLAFGAGNQCGGGGGSTVQKPANSDAKANPAAAVAHMQELSGESQVIAKAMLEHIQASAHSKNPKLIETKRRTLVASVERAILKVNQVNPYNGDAGLKDATLKFLNIMYSVLREDYARLVDMEEVAEQSYDLMEAYLLARSKANYKLRAAGTELQNEEKRFAEENQVQLIESADSVGKSLEIAGRVLDYRGKIFLIHFKSYKQELYVLDALNRGDVSGIEQNRETLLKYSETGLKELAGLSAYSGDSSLADSATQMLKFYRDEARDGIPVLTDFLLRKSQFENVQKAFELKPANQRTQADVDNFNAQVNQVNAAGKLYNQTNDRLNRDRANLINHWNQTNERFLARHIPK